MCVMRKRGSITLVGWLFFFGSTGACLWGEWWCGGEEGVQEAVRGAGNWANANISFTLVDSLESAWRAVSGRPSTTMRRPPSHDRQGLRPSHLLRHLDPCHPYPYVICVACHSRRVESAVLPVPPGMLVRIWGGSAEWGRKGGRCVQFPLWSLDHWHGIIPS